MARRPKINPQTRHKFSGIKLINLKNYSEPRTTNNLTEQPTFFRMM